MTIPLTHQEFCIALPSNYRCRDLHVILLEMFAIKDQKVLTNADFRMIYRYRHIAKESFDALITSDATCVVDAVITNTLIQEIAVAATSRVFKTLTF